MNPQALLSENRQLKAENFILKNKALEQEAHLNWLKRQLFGKRSEKLIEDKDIKQLRFEGFEVEKTKEKPSDIKPHKRKKPNKGVDTIQIPDDLPIEKQTIDLPEDQKVINGEPLKKIGEETSSKLCYKPGSYYIKQIIRPKYKTPEGSIATAELPDSLLPRCKADESLIAQIITQKYVDHLPLYRISEILKRGDIHISRKTLCKWVNKAASTLKPLHEALNKQILKSQNIFADETPIAMLKPGNKKTHQSYMWVIVGGQSSNPSNRVYHFRTSRAHIHIHEILQNYQGNLHSDKYGAYQTLSKSPSITWMPCWAHIRRKFFESRPSEVADEYLEKIRELFQYEELAWEQSPENRLIIRQEKQLPIIEELITKAKNEISSGKHLPKSNLYKALGYLLSLSPHLKNYLNKPEARIDNNVAERAIRPLALGRKNWLFAGSEEGGENAAILLSLVQTCQAHKINPQEYLEDIMRRIMGHNSQKLHELLPEAWAKEKAPPNTS